MNQVVFVGFILLIFQCSFILTDTRATSTTKRYDTKPSDPTSTPNTTTRYDTKVTSKSTTPQTKASETTATTHSTTKKTTTTHKSGTTSHTESTNTTAGTPTTHYTTATVQTTTIMPKPDPTEPNTYQWTAKSSNDTCFMAMAGLQFRASYIKTGEKEEPFDTIFDFSNTTKVSSTDCSSSSFKVMFNQEERKQLLTFSFSKTKTDYFLDMVELKFTVLASTFPNSTNLNKIVYAKSPSNGKLLKSPLGSSYLCSVETQVKFTGNESKSGISGLFMRMTDISELQAYTNAEKKDATKCFHDQPKPKPTLGNWTASNKDGVCARVTSVMILNVGYFNIGRTRKNVQIPVEGDKVKILSSSCTDNQTMMTLDVFQDKSINLTLTFTTDQKDKNYVLSNASLIYETTNPYFQNHEGFPLPTKLAPTSSLKWAPTPVGFSFRCDLSQEQIVVNDTENSLSINFKSNTQWEAFGIGKSGKFNEALYCPGEESTTPSSTTQPMTPHPIIPKDPVVETFEVMNKKNETCFLGNIGVQLRTTYFQTNETEKTDIGFNFMKNQTMISGSCSGDMSEVIFFSKDRQQTIAMMFSRNKTSNETYLNKITVMYNMTSTYFPNANETVDPKLVNVTMSGIQMFQASKDSSYKCSTERDILVDHQNSVIVRILGVQLQAFDIKNGKYSKASQCFADTMKNSTGKTGDWFVKNKNKTCARYQFASVVNITYPTLMGKDATTIFVLDNSTTNPNGFCSNVSQLSLVIDNNTFIFTFNKTDEKGGVFNYEMIDFHVHYSVKSKYFPNHAYDADGFVDLGNSSISLFQASSDHSYTCSAEVSVTFNMTNTVSFKNVKVQPFGVTESGGFSKAEDCNADKDLSPVIPIVVGAVLAFLVVLVIVAYVIGRKRARSVEYESI